MPSDQDSDYIVIGAGATGCVVANRLTEDAGIRVLLLEAGGPDGDPNILTMKGFMGLWGSEIDWRFLTTPQPGMAGREIFFSQGKVIGGSSSIHAMMYVRGNRRNYDHWNYVGADGWSYDEVLPYFKKSEHYQGGPSEYHGSGGPLSVRENPTLSPVAHAFMAAAAEQGYQGSGPGFDANGARQEDAAGPIQVMITRDGKRCSAAHAFLHPVLERPNLSVETGAHVARILIEGGRAVGVEYSQAGETHRVRAEREVIVSAGAFLSPQLLMLSGIGPAEHLRDHGIAVVADLPGVGQNLQDHVQIFSICRSPQQMPEPTILAEAALYFRAREGMTAAAPDIQLLFASTVPQLLPEGAPHDVSIFVPVLVQPHSRGSVSLRSPNPQDPPLINPNYLQCDADVRALVRAFEVVRELAGSAAFADFNGGELAPGPDADLEAYIRNGALTLWHPAGTCRIGHDAGAVVDPRLRVHGLQGLRVADASVMPDVPSGNTFAPAAMVGEKAADMIKESR